MTKIGRPKTYKTEEERKAAGRESSRRYREKNPERQKIYYAANTEVVKDRVRKSQAKKPEKYKIYQDSYQKKNKEVLAPKMKKNRETRIRYAITEWKRGNPEPFWEYRLPFLASRTKKNNIPFNLTVENMTTLTYRQRFCCYYTKFLLVSYFGSGDKKKKDIAQRMHTLSIDRIDPSKGYLINNVVLVSDFVNTVKLNLNNQEFLTLIYFIINKFAGKAIKPNKIHTLFKSNRQKFDKFRKLISSKKYINKLNKDIYLGRRQKRKYYPDIKSFKEIDDVI
tara:strand:+ start:959 stop:1798 length:840 start_codon:yes stop_codon:yes gene_type:complete